MKGAEEDSYSQESYILRLAEEVTRTILRSARCETRHHDNPADFAWNCGDCLLSRSRSGGSTETKRQKELQKVVLRALRREGL